MKRFTVITLSLLACSTTLDYPSVPPYQEKDVGPVEAGALQDAGFSTDVEADLFSYRSCVSKIRVPTSYPRLQKQTCVDSNNQTNDVGYWDTSLQILCRWMTAEDGSVRCLPWNLQSSFLYSDADCSISVALTETGEFGSPYLGLLDIVGDASIRLKMFKVGEFSTGEPKYFLAQLDGNWKCMETNLMIIGTRTVKVGPEVSPDVFVAE